MLYHFLDKVKKKKFYQLKSQIYEIVSIWFSNIQESQLHRDDTSTSIKSKPQHILKSIYCMIQSRFFWCVFVINQHWWCNSGKKNYETSRNRNKANFKCWRCKNIWWWYIPHQHACVSRPLDTIHWTNQSYD